MKIAEVRIHNFCSIRDLELSLSDFMVLVGPNNHGKSNVLRALDFALSPAAKPTMGDFCKSRLSGDDEIWVEVTFRGLTEQESVTFSKYVRHDGSICIRKTAGLSPSGVIDTGYNGYVQEPQICGFKNVFARLDTREKVEHEASSNPQPVNCWHRRPIYQATSCQLSERLHRGSWL